MGITEVQAGCLSNGFFVSVLLSGVGNNLHLCICVLVLVALL